MHKQVCIVITFLSGAAWCGIAGAAEATLSGPVLSVYDDGFRIADENALAVRVDAWSLCGDTTRDHISRGDRLTVQGDREWRFLYAASVTRADGTSACPKEAAPQ
jgi:hypothetical protein